MSFLFLCLVSCPLRTCVLSYVRLLVTLWTVARQTPSSMGFPRQEHWNQLPFPPAGHLPDPGIERDELHWQEDSFTTGTPGKPVSEPLWLVVIAACLALILDH